MLTVFLLPVSRHLTPLIMFFFMLAARPHLIPWLTWAISPEYLTKEIEKGFSWPSGPMDWSIIFRASLSRMDCAMFLSQNSGSNFSEKRTKTGVFLVKYDRNSGYMSPQKELSGAAGGFLNKKR